MSDPGANREQGGDHAAFALDAAAYVLGALEPHEADRFRAHAAGCVVCRDEVQALRAAAETLALGAPQLAVPRSLRRRVLGEVRRERRAGALHAARSGPRAPLRLPAVRSPAVLAGALALAAAIVIVAAAPWGGSSQGKRVIDANVTSPVAHAALRLSAGRGELVIAGMAHPPAGRVYEVWVRRAGSPPAPTSALFDVTSAGTAAVAVPGNLDGVSEVLVTAEPRGGSAHPTSAPVIRAQLS
jgi:hypothetical protein